MRLDRSAVSLLQFAFDSGIVSRGSWRGRMVAEEEKRDEREKDRSRDGLRSMQSFLIKQT
jgi:hypothetical protein